PGRAVTNPDVAVTEGFRDLEKALRRDSEKFAELCNVFVRRLITPRPNNGHRLFTRHPAVADFQRKIIEQPGKTELVPFQPMMNGDEVVIDVGVIVETSTGAFPVGNEAVFGSNPARRLGIPLQIVAKEDRQNAGG